METTILEPTNIERDLAEAIHLNLHALSKFEEPRQEYLDCFTSSTAVVSYNTTTVSIIASVIALSLFFFLL